MSGSVTTDTAHARAARIGVRIDRLPAWSLPAGASVALGLCYFFVFYDIAVVSAVLPTVVTHLRLSEAETGLPVTANLLAYVVGAYLFGTVADRVGRRRSLFACMALLAVSSLATALSWDLASLTVFRAISGVAMGAQIALAGTFVGELAPAALRGRAVARNVVWAAVGNVVPPVLGSLLLPATPVGWRVLFGLVALGALVLPLFTDRCLPESPRWLALHGQWDRAERVVDRMEQRLAARGVELSPVSDQRGEATAGKAFPTTELFHRPYLARLVTVFGFWFCFYFAVYGFLAFESTLIGKLNVGPVNAVLLTGLGFVGGVVAAAVQPLVIDRVQRRTLVVAGLLVEICGFALLALATVPGMVLAGSFLASAGIFAVIIPGYAYTAEVFPTRARASAMGIGDGIGHLGGAVQPYVLLPVLAAAGARPGFWLLAGAMAVAVLFMTTAIRTSGRPLADLAR